MQQFLGAVQATKLASFQGHITSMNSALTCVDLFAGCGGLSLGLKHAGFEVKLAVEKSPMASETYYHNLICPVRNPEEWRRFHEDLSVEEQARSGLVVRELSEVLAFKSILSQLRDAEIDLVAGGPPCQGFSLAGRRNPRDVRNLLPWQFLKFVDAVRPKAVIIENVSGIRRKFRKHCAAAPIDELRVELAKTNPGYAVQPMLLNAMHFGVPQHRPRVFLVAMRRDLLGDPGNLITGSLWDSSFDYAHTEMRHKRPLLAPKRTHSDVAGKPEHLTVWDAISDLFDGGYRLEEPVSDYARQMRAEKAFLKAVEPTEASVGCPANHVLRRHSEFVKARFQLYQYFRQSGIHPQVLSIPTKTGIPEARLRSMIRNFLASVDYPALLEDGTILARNERAMVRLVRRLATKKHSQRALSWHKPAPTVMALPDDFVHPSVPRIPTVRELARFQSFPDSFEFRSKETTGSMRRRVEVPQYTQVGNAVPPRLAQALGNQLREVLSAVSVGRSLRSHLPTSL